MGAYYYQISFIKINSIILGEYISYHTDDERFLAHTTVASISLGALRTFKVRRSPHGAICKLKSKRVLKTKYVEKRKGKGKKQINGEMILSLLVLTFCIGTAKR